MLGTIYGGLQMFTDTFAGYYSDKLGRRTVMIYALVGASLGDEATPRNIIV
jgi:hypothetical protein